MSERDDIFSPESTFARIKNFYYKTSVIKGLINMSNMSNK